MEVPFVDLVKILHSGEGRDVKQWLEPRNKFSCVCDWFLLTLYCFTFLYLFYYLFYFSILHTFHLLAFSVYTHINKEAIKHLNS